MLDETIEECKVKGYTINQVKSICELSYPSRKKDWVELLLEKMTDTQLSLLPFHLMASFKDKDFYSDFQEAVEARDDLSHVFLITDSEEAFQEMAAQLRAPHVIQLYRDYLENFAINRGDLS